MSAALLLELNTFRTAAGMQPLKSWKNQRNLAELEIFREDARREAAAAEAIADAGDADDVVVEDVVTFDLTSNEFHAAMILVNDCLAGMGGQRPSDLENDEYTWVDAQSLIAHGWSAPEAAGTFSALVEKGVIYEADTNQMALATDAWRWLDTQWDANIELASMSKQRTEYVTNVAASAIAAATAAAQASKPAKAPKPAKVEMPTQHGIKRPRPGGLCAQAWDMFDRLGRGVVIADALAEAAKIGLNQNNIRTELCRWRKFNAISMK